MEKNNEKEIEFVYATENDTLAEAIQKTAEQHCTGEIIRLDDKLIDTITEARSKEKRATTVSEFVADGDNKDEAEKKALCLWNMVTNNTPVENASGRIFTKTEIVRRTTLTHKALGELLELFRLFGFIEFVKGNYEFRFIFSQKTKQDNAYADIVEDIRLLNINIARYKNLLSEDEFTERWDKLRENITQLISF